MNTFHSAKDGVETGRVRTSFAPDNTFANGLIVDEIVSTNQWGGPKDRQWVYVDPGAGQRAEPLYPDGQIWGNRYLAYNGEDDDEAFIKVWDLNTSQVIFSRTGKDVVGLNIEDIFLAGDYATA